MLSEPKISISAASFEATRPSARAVTAGLAVLTGQIYQRFSTSCSIAVTGAEEYCFVRAVYKH